MGAARIQEGSSLAGRGVEQQLLVQALQAAANGRPCAVAVHGEAGIGKTRLVRDVCGSLGSQTEVMWGTCVHFGEVSVPFAPLIGALQGWRSRADAATCAEVLSGVDDLEPLLPPVSGRAGGDQGRLIPVVDLVVNRLARRGPTILVVDDLQWADRASLDGLAYLITGLHEQRLAVLMTCRDEHRGEGHPLHGWLADMRRMPGFSEIHVGRLDLAGTQDQIQGLLGQAPADLGFAALVQERSDGNPYLTELLVRDLSGAETDLPATAPAALREALLATWHGLSGPARQVTRMLAVAGRPVEAAVLANVVTEHGIAPERLSACLTEAGDHGVTQPDNQGRAWFRHPLLAEVLYEAIPADEAARVHATYVPNLESSSSSAPERVAADLAVHNYRAGRIDEAYRWSIVAAEHARQLHAKTEEAIHLERACALWGQVSHNIRGTTANHIDLLLRTSRSCGHARRNEANANLLELALSLVDRDRDPLLASTLLIASSEATHSQSVRGKTLDDELAEALRLTKPFPDSAEHALALAKVAFAEHWDGLDRDAAIHAELAVQAAYRSGSESALAAALSARALARLLDPASTHDSLADAREAQRLARSCGSNDWLEEAAIWETNCLSLLGRTAEATTVAQNVFEEVLADGSEFAYFLAARAADGLLWLGRWNECHDLLRTALAAGCQDIPGAAIRLTAAQLAARRGHVAEAELHLERALELVAADYAGLHGALTEARTEVFLAAGESEQALAWLHSRIVVPPPDNPSAGEDLLAVFAHAAAEVASAAKDAGDNHGARRAIGMLDDILGRWPAKPFTTARPDVADQAMANALFDAETARARDEPKQPAFWRRAANAAHAAGCPWEEATANLRCAEAILATESQPSSAAEQLRSAHSTAVKLGAEPLQRHIEALARIARIALSAPVPIVNHPSTPGALAALTDREREILAFLVAGRSNREIAKALVISDKTVSVHVTNILRKTGTTTRIEAAALAERLQS